MVLKIRFGDKEKIHKEYLQGKFYVRLQADDVLISESKQQIGRQLFLFFVSWQTVGIHKELAFFNEQNFTRLPHDFNIKILLTLIKLVVSLQILFLYLRAYNLFNNVFTLSETDEFP